MIDDADGLAYRAFDGDSVLATQGKPAYSEAVVDGWRRWSTQRSKLGSMIDRGMELPLDESTRVLYLGAASGTTVSHLADVVDVVYAIEFAPRPMAELLDIAADRPNIIPLLADARRPEAYGHVVESGIDVIVQDVATRDQANVARVNRRFLDADGYLVLAIKARSEDVTAPPRETYDAVVSDLEADYQVVERIRLDPEHRDHLAVLARPQGNPPVGTEDL